jgi:ADP-ribose pyrophosphatase
VRELFERGDAIAVLPYDPKTDSLVMIEQFRPGALRGDDSPWMLELIAGVVEAGERDEDVCHREAYEEAGCELAELTPIATVFPSAGGCTEQVRLFCGHVIKASIGGLHGLQDEGEDILVHSISRGDALKMLAENQILNGHTLIALQWLHMHGESLRERWC